MVAVGGGGELKGIETEGCCRGAAEVDGVGAEKGGVEAEGGGEAGR